MRKRVPKRVLNMAKNPINIRSKTPLVSTLTRATMAKRRAYRLYTWTLLFLSRWVQNLKKRYRPLSVSVLNVIVSSDNSHCGKYYNIHFFSYIFNTIHYGGNIINYKYIVNIIHYGGNIIHTFLTLFTMGEILYIHI